MIQPESHANKAYPGKRSALIEVNVPATNTEEREEPNADRE